MWSPFFRCCTENMNNLICFNVLIHALTCVDATTFVEFIKTSRQLFGAEMELNVTDIRPNAMLLHLLSTCVTRADCQAVDAQQNKLLTNVSGVSATNGHAPMYISAVGSTFFGLLNFSPNNVRFRTKIYYINITAAFKINNTFIILV